VREHELLAGAPGCGSTASARSATRRHTLSRFALWSQAEVSASSTRSNASKKSMKMPVSPSRWRVTCLPNPPPNISTSSSR